MANIIDALLVSLSLDASGFKKGAKDVGKGLKDTESDAEKTAKNLQAQGKKAAEFFSQIRNQVIALATTFTAGAGLKSFAEHLTTADAATGRAARNFGVAAEVLSTWQGVAERAGGTAAGVTGAMQALSGEFQHAFRTGESTVIPMMQQWGIAVSKFTDKRGNIADMNGLLLSLADAFHKPGVSAARAHEAFDGLVGTDTVNVLLHTRQALAGLYEEQQKINVASQADTDAGEKRQAAYRKMGQAFEQLGRIIMTQLTPALDSLADLLSEMAAWFQDHPKVLDVFAAGLALAAGILTAALVSLRVRGFLALIGVIKKVPAAAVGAGAAIEATAASTAAASTTMMGALGGVLALLGKIAFAGWAAHEALKLVDEHDDLGTWIDEHSTIASWLDNAASKVGLGRSYEEQRAAVDAKRKRAAGEPIEEPRSGKTNAPASPAAKTQAEADIRRMMEMGWSRPAAAGIVANLTAESAGNERAVGDRGEAYGLAQWHKDRQQAFARWAGKDIRQSSHDEQLQFVNHELRSGEDKGARSAGAALAAARTAEEAARAFTRLYERPKNVEADSAKRANIAALLGPGPQVDRALLAGAGASAAVAANTTNTNATTNTHSTETNVKIDNINLPNATDADSTAKGLSDAMQKHFMLAAQANYGLT